MASSRGLRAIADVVTIADASGTRAAFEEALLFLLERAIDFDVAFVQLADGGRSEVTLTGLGSERSAAAPS
jgi:hypothetical protein